MTKTINLYKEFRNGKNKSNPLNWFDFASPKFGGTFSKILTEEDNLIISLTGIEFIKPEILVWLAFIILYRSKSFKSTSLSLPNNNDVLNYIKFTQFDELKREINFRIINEFLLPMKSKYSYSHPEMQKILYTNQNNYARKSKILFEHVNEYLKEELGINAPNERLFFGLRPFIRTIDEIVENMILYSGRDGIPGEGIISLFPSRKYKKYVTYCFSDIGYGFAESLNRKKQSLHINSEYDAILKGLLYRYNYPKNGILGLFYTLKFIADQFGTISIRSQNVLVKFNFSDSDKRAQFYRKFTNNHNERPSLKWLTEISNPPYYSHYKLPGVHIRITMKLRKSGVYDYENN